MKNALILHGAMGSSKENWFPWLGGELTSRGYTTWVPDLPQPEKPSMRRWNDFIFSRYKIDRDSILIGHSAGAAAILGILQELPADTVVDKVFLVAGFTDNLAWEPLFDLFSVRLNWPTIRSRAKNIVLFHSDDDPYVPLWHGEKLRDLLGADLMVMPGQKHFSLSTNPVYNKFPKLLEKILK